MEPTENTWHCGNNEVDANTWANFPLGYARPDWLPDWQKFEEYTDHGNDMQAWAWECLRRNPEYQADYAQWAALPDTETDANGVSGWSRKYELTYGDDERMLFFYANPPALSDDETVAEYAQRTGNYPDLLHVHLCRKWGGLVRPTAPEGYGDGWFIDEPMRAPFELECIKAKVWQRPICGMRLHDFGIAREIMVSVRLDLGRDDNPDTRDIDTRLDSDDYRIFAFDLRADPEQQTEEVLAILRQYRTERHKKKKQKSGAQLSKIIQRLRVFDAVWTLGIGHQAHIGQVIFGRNADSIVSTDLSTAKRLILNGGYREFLAR